MYLALATAATAVAKVTDDKACDTVLSNYVHMWRKGHLEIVANKVQEVAQPVTVPEGAGTQLALSREPSITILSGTTVLLHFPSFYAGYQSSIETLLDTHRAALASAAILMVRWTTPVCACTPYPRVSAN